MSIDYLNITLKYINETRNSLKKKENYQQYFDLNKINITQPNIIELEIINIILATKEAIITADRASKSAFDIRHKIKNITELEFTNVNKIWENVINTTLEANKKIINVDFFANSVVTLINMVLDAMKTKKDIKEYFDKKNLILKASYFEKQSYLAKFILKLRIIETVAMIGEYALATWKIKKNQKEYKDILLIITNAIKIVMTITEEIANELNLLEIKKMSMLLKKIANTTTLKTKLIKKKIKVCKTKNDVIKAAEMLMNIAKTTDIRIEFYDADIIKDIELFIVKAVKGLWVTARAIQKLIHILKTNLLNKINIKL